MKIYLGLAALTFSLSVGNAHAGTIEDGNFVGWTFGSTGTATASLEPAGGNPGARLNISTISGERVRGIALNPTFSSTSSLQGSPFTLSLDFLSGLGASVNGQGIALLVLQGTTLYEFFLGETGFSNTWNTVSFTQAFLPTNFTRLDGLGPLQPDFASGVTTSFGFAGSNAFNGSVTQYYDNFRLESAALVPEPSTFGLLLLGSTFLSVWLLRRQKLGSTFGV